MQDHKDPRSFTIVERYAHENSQKSVLPRHLLIYRVMLWIGSLAAP